MHGVVSLSDQLVSVVVPSYNAAKTLDDTLRSVRGQTHTELDIVVVDDGSTDATAAVAQAHVDADPRVRLIRQPNGGVAAARNTGWRAARAEFVALIDSDDLWAPQMIEKSLAALLAGGPQTGFAYCFFTHIDAMGMAARPHIPEPRTGDVLDRILAFNFVGNGSVMLIRRAVIEACDGFDESLRTAGAQGCDDYLFCCRAAEICHFACVPEVLVGYRETPDSISSSVARMLRSWMLVTAQMLERHPGKGALILSGLQGYAEWLLGSAVYHRRFRQLRPILLLLLRYHPAIARAVIFRYLPRLGLTLLRQRVSRLRQRLALRHRLRGLPVTVAPAPVPRTPFPVGAPPRLQVSD